MEKVVVNLQLSYFLSCLSFAALTPMMLTLQGGDFGGDDFSSGEQNSYSDGETSPGGSPRSGYTSGSESEREAYFDFFDEGSQSEAKRIDLVAPLIKSRHTFAKRFVRINQFFSPHIITKVPPHWLSTLSVLLHFIDGILPK